MSPDRLRSSLPSLRAFFAKQSKRILGELPFTAELYWQLRQQGKPVNKSFALNRTAKWLPQWLSQAEVALSNSRSDTPCTSGLELLVRHDRKVLVFTTLRYWIEHATLLGIALAGLGDQVTLAYLPYANWHRPINRFDLRRHNAYAQNMLQRASPLMRTISFMETKSAGSRGSMPSLPKTLVHEIEAVSERDVQYTLQVEEVDHQDALYRLRMERNLQAATAALAWMQANHPQVLITPNGSIIEMGAVYQVARFLDIPVVTYEFGEQRGRIWLAQNGEVMRQDTIDMWQSCRHTPLTSLQWGQIRALYASRQQANLWENFTRRWQGQPGQGGAQVRQALGLGDGSDSQQPVVLLAANVIGDSLTLGRQVFTRNMTEWLERTLRTLAQNPQVMVIVRVHPGERYTKGPSVADLVRRILPDLPAHMRLVGASDPVNTYDLVEIADLGLVYTTTVGMEMAMSGVPVIVAGLTHYRAKGFTLDPDSWQTHDQMLEREISGLLARNDPAANRLSREQVEQAWTYAYRFFFDFPLPFPWHLLHFWNELDTWSLEKVLSPEGLAQFGEAFDCLIGEPRCWRTN